jgi:hypothetical protein
VVTATSKILFRGGVLILLPFIVSSYTQTKGGGIGLGYGITDNIYQLNIRDGGQIISVSPYLFCTGLLDIDYFGDVALINLEIDNLLLSNEMELAKKILLPGIGNKTVFYAVVSSFYTPAYEQYRTFDITGGNSLHVYLSKYLFSLDTEVRYKNFLLDSLTDYVEPRLNIACAIPLPYFILTPEIETGFRKYFQEFVPFYRTGSSVFLPLTLDFSAAMVVNYLHVSQPQSNHIIPLSYADDPFFEQENLSESITLEMSATRVFQKQRVFVEVDFDLFQKTFYEIEGLQRTDKGIEFNIGFTKFIRSNMRLHLNGRSHANASTIDDFDYMKNEIEVNLELIF